MATVVNFQGRNYIEPGAYAAIVYNPTSVVNVAEFGNVMIIDTGLSLNTVGGQQLEFAGGSGVKGQLAQGLKSVYEFTSYEDFLAFIRQVRLYFRERNHHVTITVSDRPSNSATIVGGRQYVEAVT